MEFDAVRNLVRSTRPMLLPHWGNVTDRAKDGSARSVVTDLDLTIERYLADELKKIDSSIAFAGEEFGGSRDAERLWLCDPIDGTAHFVRGLPFCTTMLALIEDGHVTFSCVYDFVGDRLFHAARGKGAYRDTEAIRVSTRKLTQSYIAFESKIEKEANYHVRNKLGASAILFNSITAGYELSLVASGKLEARICLDGWGQDWDFAPGSLLVEEAGGTVLNIGAYTYDYRNSNMIAGNPEVVRSLTEGHDAIFPISQQ